MNDIAAAKKYYTKRLTEREAGVITQEALESGIAHVTVELNFDSFAPELLPPKPMDVSLFEEDKGSMKEEKIREILLKSRVIKEYYDNISSAKNHNRSNFLYLLDMLQIFEKESHYKNKGKVEEKLMLYNRDNMNLWTPSKYQGMIESWIESKRTYL